MRACARVLALLAPCLSGDAQGWSQVTRDVIDGVADKSDLVVQARADDESSDDDSDDSSDSSSSGGDAVVKPFAKRAPSDAPTAAVDRERYMAEVARQLAAVRRLLLRVGWRPL